MEKLKVEQGIIQVQDIKQNPNNPRTIKVEQLNKLKKSITEFPDMLALRPIVIDENDMVIGGNMRLRALTELGIQETPFIKVFDLDEEKRKEFLIKDNLNYGEWNWDLIKQDWDFGDIEDWGLDIPNWLQDDDIEPQFDQDELDKALSKYINGKIKQIICYFDPKQYELMISKMDYIMQREDLENHTQVLVYLVDLYGEIKKLND